MDLTRAGEQDAFNRKQPSVKLCRARDAMPVREPVTEGDTAVYNQRAGGKTEGDPARFGICISPTVCRAPRAQLSHG